MIELASFSTINLVKKASIESPPSPTFLSEQLHEIYFKDDYEVFPNFNSDDPSSPLGLLHDTKILRLKKTGSMIMDDDPNYKPFSNKQEDKREKKVYSMTKNFRSMMKNLLGLKLPYEEETLLAPESFRESELPDLGGNNLF